MLYAYIEYYYAVLKGSRDHTFLYDISAFVLHFIFYFFCELGRFLYRFL